MAACSVLTRDGWHNLFRGQPGPYLYLTDTNGIKYDSCSTAPPPRITIEDAGPLRASICISGFHASNNGVLMCPYTFRIHAYAGKDYLRAFHTFVFDQNPDTLEFSQVGINLLVDLGDNVRMAFGGQDRTHWADRWQTARILQSSDLEYNVTRDEESFGCGEKTQGWAGLSGSSASAFVAVRDFWQQYPKAFELDTADMDIQLWPASCDESLVYSTPWKERPVFFNGTRDEATVCRLLEEKPTAPLNLKSFAPETIEDVLWIESMVDKHAPDRPATHNDVDMPSDGTGAGKTHELLLCFSASPIDDEAAEALATFVQEPLIAPADPAYACATRAARDLFGGRHERFDELDELLDDIVEKVAIEPMELCRLWGFWRFGNMCASHAAGPGLIYQAYYNTDPIKAMRFVGSYNNEADDPCWGLWTQFLRTSDRRIFLAASGFSRAMGEVGICHAHPIRPEVVGLVHYHGGHQWTGGHSHSHTLNTALFLHYYLTGDRRMREIALEVADNAVRNQEPAGIISCRHGRLNREFTGPLLCTIEAYVDTWFARYGDVARRSLNWLLRTQQQPGVFPISVYTRGELGDEALIETTENPLSHSGIVYPIFYEGLRHFDSPLLRETILHEADRVISRNAGGHVGTACALAYEMTEDPIYAAFCHHALEAYIPHARISVHIADIALFSAIRNGYIAVLKATVARAIETDEESFVNALQRLSSLLGSEEIVSKPISANPDDVHIGVPDGYDT